MNLFKKRAAVYEEMGDAKAGKIKCLHCRKYRSKENIKGCYECGVDVICKR